MTPARTVMPLALVPLVVLSAACGAGGTSAGSPTTPTATATPAATAPGGAPIFEPGALHDARLALDPAAWEALRRNYLSNQYYAADLTIDGVTVRQAGIRSRGSGSRDEDKPGLKVEFDKYVPGQEYYGYKSLVLDNLAQDPTCLRERLSFLVFEAMGIASPRNSFARLSVNGEYWGVYALVEPISKPFLEARLGEKNGTLYDYTWSGPYDFSWLGPNSARYVPLPFQPETNESKPDVASGLVAFIQAINETPDASFPSAIGAWLDVERFLTHVAVENAIVEGDGVVGDLGLNNFYLYEYGSGRRFVFVPWDKDSTFRAASWPLYRNLDANVLTRRLVADPARRQYYADAVVRAVTSFVNPRWLTPQLDSAYQQIRAAAREDVRKPFTNAEFEASVEGTRSVIASREADVRAQR